MNIKNAPRFGKVGPAPEGRRCVACPAKTGISLYAWSDQALRRRDHGPFGLCDDCMAAFSEPGGFVYFIRAGDVVKIGYSGDPKRRLKDLTTGSPVPLELWRHMPGTEQDERGLHKRFAEERTHGEWFQLSDRLLAYIEEIA